MILPSSLHCHYNHQYYPRRDLSFGEEDFWEILLILTLLFSMQSEKNWSVHKKVKQIIINHIMPANIILVHTFDLKINSKLIISQAPKTNIKPEISEKFAVCVVVSL